jgi:hypothetical protein
MALTARGGKIGVAHRLRFLRTRSSKLPRGEGETRHGGKRATKLTGVKVFHDDMQTPRRGRQQWMRI